MRSRLIVAGVLAVGVGVLAACESQTTPSAPPEGVSFSHAGTSGEGHFVLCKEGADGMFNVTILEENRPAHGNGGSFSVTSANGDDNTTMVTVAAGECLELYEARLIPGALTPITDITVDEIVKPGFQLDKIVWDSVAHSQVFTETITGTTSFTTGVRDDIGAVVTYFNSVAKSCAVCKGGVTEMTLQNNGPDATITVEDKKGNVLFSGFVASGDSFTFNGVDKNGKMGTEITVTANGVETKIHTSCSQPLGPGAVYGDFEIVEAFSEKGGKICPTTPPGPATSCDFGKPQMLVFTYTGESCSASDHDQGSKVSCTGDPAFASIVDIRASDKQSPTDTRAKVWFSGTASLGGSFTIDATAAGENKLKASTVLHIFEAGTSNVIQQIEFHTSCSQPLDVGDQFGSAILTDFIPQP